MSGQGIGQGIGGTTVNVPTNTGPNYVPPPPPPPTPDAGGDVLGDKNPNNDYTIVFKDGLWQWYSLSKNAYQPIVEQDVVAKAMQQVDWGDSAGKNISPPQEFIDKPLETISGDEWKRVWDWWKAGDTHTDNETKWFFTMANQFLEFFTNGVKGNDGNMIVGGLLASRVEGNERWTFKMTYDLKTGNYIGDWVNTTPSLYMDDIYEPDWFSTVKTVDEWVTKSTEWREKAEDNIAFLYNLYFKDGGFDNVTDRETIMFTFDATTYSYLSDFLFGSHIMKDFTTTDITYVLYNAGLKQLQDAQASGKFTQQQIDYGKNILDTLNQMVYNNGQLDDAKKEWLKWAMTAFLVTPTMVKNFEEWKNNDMMNIQRESQNDAYWENYTNSMHLEAWQNQIKKDTDTNKTFTMWNQTTGAALKYDAKFKDELNWITSHPQEADLTHWFLAYGASYFKDNGVTGNKFDATYDYSKWVDSHELDQLYDASWDNTYKASVKEFTEKIKNDTKNFPYGVDADGNPKLTNGEKDKNGNIIGISAEEMRKRMIDQEVMQPYYLSKEDIERRTGIPDIESESGLAQYGMWYSNWKKTHPYAEIVSEEPALDEDSYNKFLSQYGNKSDDFTVSTKFNDSKGIYETIVRRKFDGAIVDTFPCISKKTGMKDFHQKMEPYAEKKQLYELAKGGMILGGLIVSFVMPIGVGALAGAALSAAGFGAAGVTLGGAAIGGILGGVMASVATWAMDPSRSFYHDIWGDLGGSSADERMDLVRDIGIGLACDIATLGMGQFFASKFFKSTVLYQKFLTAFMKMPIWKTLNKARQTFFELFDPKKIGSWAQAGLRTLREKFISTTGKVLTKARAGAVGLYVGGKALYRGGKAVISHVTEKIPSLKTTFKQTEDFTESTAMKEARNELANARENIDKVIRDTRADLESKIPSRVDDAQKRIEDAKARYKKSINDEADQAIKEYFVPDEYFSQKTLDLRAKAMKDKRLLDEVMRDFPNDKNMLKTYEANARNSAEKATDALNAERKAAGRGVTISSKWASKGLESTKVTDKEIVDQMTHIRNPNDLKNFISTVAHRGEDEVIGLLKDIERSGDALYDDIGKSIETAGDVLRGKKTVDDLLKSTRAFTGKIDEMFSINTLSNVQEAAENTQKLMKLVRDLTKPGVRTPKETEEIIDTLRNLSMKVADIVSPRFAKGINDLSRTIKGGGEIDDVMDTLHDFTTAVTDVIDRTGLTTKTIDTVYDVTKKTKSVIDDFLDIKLGDDVMKNSNFDDLFDVVGREGMEDTTHLIRTKPSVVGPPAAPPPPPPPPPANAYEGTLTHGGLDLISDGRKYLNIVNEMLGRTKNVEHLTGLDSILKDNTLRHRLNATVLGLKNQKSELYDMRYFQDTVLSGRLKPGSVISLKLRNASQSAVRDSVYHRMLYVGKIQRDMNLSAYKQINAALLKENPTEFYTRFLKNPRSTMTSSEFTDMAFMRTDNDFFKAVSTFGKHAGYDDIFHDTGHWMEVDVHKTQSTFIHNDRFIADKYAGNDWKYFIVETQESEKLQGIIDRAVDIFTRALENGRPYNLFIHNCDHFVNAAMGLSFMGKVTATQIISLLSMVYDTAKLGTIFARIALEYRSNLNNHTSVPYKYIHSDNSHHVKIPVGRPQKHDAPAKKGHGKTKNSRGLHWGGRDPKRVRIF